MAFPSQPNLLSLAVKVKFNVIKTFQLRDATVLTIMDEASPNKSNKSNKFEIERQFWQPIMLDTP